MTQFELILTGYSILIALCVARLLDGVGPAFQRGRFYWVHALWIVNKLLNTTLYFWGVWVYREVGVWAFPEYLVIIAAPGLVYLQCNALVTTAPEQVTSWRERFYDIRPGFFAANLLLVPLGLVSVHVVAEAPFPSPMTYSFVLVGGLSILGMLSRSPRVHGAIAVVSFLNLTLGFAMQFTRGAGGLMES